MLIVGFSFIWVYFTIRTPERKGWVGVNVILISWDGVGRDTLYSLLRAGRLSNLQDLIEEGGIFNITVTGHATDTKAGHSEMLTGYGPEITGVYSNNRYNPIPDGYTVFERVKEYFQGRVATGMITGKKENLDVENDGPFSNAREDLDVCKVAHASASRVGSEALRAIEKYSETSFLFFIHFSDPDHKGHRYGEGSEEYLEAIVSCDYWLGEIVEKLESEGIYEETFIYVTADHGFDPGSKNHRFAPYVFLATNDPDVRRNGEQKDITPTILYRMGLNLEEIEPPLPGMPLQLEKPLETYSIVVYTNITLGEVDVSLWANIGYDPIYLGTVGDANMYFWRLAGEYGCFRYVRCHNLFSDSDYGCMIYSEDDVGNPVYNWTRLDAVLDAWVSAGLKPILECDFMPDILAKGEIVRNYGGGAINPPNDYEKWRDLIYNTVRHCVERYGLEEVRTWYWEIWNEPDLSSYFLYAPKWRGQTSEKWAEEFCKMYDYFVDAVKSVDPELKVGGPAIAGNTKLLDAFLNHCVNGVNYVTGERGTEIDFISWHGYGTIERMMEKNRLVKSIIAKYPELAGCELHQNEWGLPLGSRASNYLAMSNYESAFLCKYIAGMLTDESASLDLFLRWGRPTFYERGWRPLLYVSDYGYVELATFNTYRLLGIIQGEYVELEGVSFEDPVYGFASKNGDSVYVLLYHFDEDDLMSDGPPARVNLTVESLDGWETAHLTRYMVGRYNCNPYEAWRLMGQPKSLNASQISILKKESELKPVQAMAVDVYGGKLNIEFELPANSVTLIILEKAEDEILCFSDDPWWNIREESCEFQAVVSSGISEYCYLIMDFTYSLHCFLTQFSTPFSFISMRFSMQPNFTTPGWLFSMLHGNSGHSEHRR